MLVLSVSPGPLFLIQLVEWMGKETWLAWVSKHVYIAEVQYQLFVSMHVRCVCKCTRLSLAPLAIPKINIQIKVLIYWSVRFFCWWLAFLPQLDSCQVEAALHCSIQDDKVVVSF